MKTNVTLLMMFGCMVCSAAVNTQPKFTLNTKDFSLVEKENAKVQMIVPKTVNKKAALAESATVEVACNLTYDFGMAYPNTVMIFNDNYSQLVYPGYFNTSTTLMAPEGTYDILFTFYNASFNQLIYVVREQVEISEGTVVNVDVAEATEHIQFRCVNPEGELWNLDTVDWEEDEDGNWNQVETVAGNLASLAISSTLVVDGAGYNGHGYVAGLMATADAVMEGVLTTDESCDFLINPVSDRFKLLQLRVMVSEDNKLYINKFETTGVSNKYVVNDPANYKSFSEEILLRDCPNAIGERYAGYDAWDNFGGYPISGWTGETGVVLVEPGQSGTFYLDLPSSVETGIDYDVVFAPTITEIEQTSTGLVSYPTIGTTVTFNGDSYKYVYVATDEYHFQQTTPTQDFPYMNAFPGLDRFSFSVDQKGGVQGDNVPIQLFSMTDYPSVPGTYLDWEFTYYGIYGEAVSSMVRDAKYCLVYDGEEIPCDDHNAFNAFPYNKYVEDNYFDGLIDLSITSDFGMIDGLQGTNVSRILVDPKNQDKAAPTLRMLQIRDNQNNVTNLVGDRAGSKVSLLAVDYQIEVVEELNQFFIANHPVTLELSYAPAGTDAWTSLQVNEMAEENSCTFGQVFEVALDDVEGGAGWYAVRVKVTDSEGNSQEQTISPAFKLDEVVSIADVKAAGAGEAYDLMGRKLSAAGQRGLYIVRDGKNARVELH